VDPVRDIEKVALLREPVRRRLYFHVREAGEPVSRDQAARAVGVSRSLAAFHLDRLADAGLLDVEYRRLTERTGRGAGRPAKLYRQAETRLAVSLPPTAYELAGEVLIEALRSGRAAETPEAAVRRSARGVGARLADELRPELGRSAGMARVRRAVELMGFEPERATGPVRLRNCPFHELARRHPGLVCGMNESFLGALADRLAGDAVRADAYAEEGYCCVLLQEEP
jgi:predicted ArsR family transcriptional regulator